MYKNLTNFFHDKPYKDLQIATNTCSTDSHCANKSGSSKFTRKQDVSRIQKKKKADNGESSLLCYLTPKNCEQSAKLIKQRMRESCAELGINSFMQLPASQSTKKCHTGKLSFKGYEPSHLSSRQTSIEKLKLSIDSQNKIMYGARSRKQSADKSHLFGYGPTTPKDNKQPTSSFKSSAMLKRQQQTPSSSLLSQNRATNLPSTYQKQLTKQRNQCQHYCSLLQHSNKSLLQTQTQVKSLTSLIAQLKQKNTSLTLSAQQLSKEIMLLNSTLTQVNQENERLRKENAEGKEERGKLVEEVSYLKDTVGELSERIDVMVEGKGQEGGEGGRFMNLITMGNTMGNIMGNIMGNTMGNKEFQHHPHSNTRRTNSMLPTTPKHLTSNSILISPQQPEQQPTSQIHDLQDQLKYCQVEISMLKRVKMDINKKNQQFIKLQKQNKILKNQIFQMKTGGLIDEQMMGRAGGRMGTMRDSGSRNRVMGGNCGNEAKGSLTSRNNFQISLQRGGRGAKDEQKSQDRSSDTLSLNLSVSPEKKGRSINKNSNSNNRA